MEAGLGGVEDERAKETVVGDAVELEEVELGEFKGRRKLECQLPDTVQEEEKCWSLEKKEGLA